jgi:hypothetical protein
MTDEERRRPGRPRLDPEDPSVNVHFRLPTKQYDAAVKRAQDERLSLADYIRRQLRGFVAKS